MLSEFIFFVLSVYEGWFLRTGTGTKPECDSPKSLRNLYFVEAGVDGNALTGKLVPWQGRVLTEADLGNSEQPEQNPNLVRSYQPETEKY